MTAAQIVAACVHRGISLRVTPDGTLKASPARAVWPGLAAVLRERKAEVVRALNFYAQNPALWKADPDTPGIPAEEWMRRARAQVFADYEAQKAMPEWARAKGSKTAPPPPVAHSACYRCGGSEWYNKPGGERMCSRCHPPTSHRKEPAAA